MRTLCVVLALILSGCVSASGASHESPEPVPSFVAVPDGAPAAQTGRMGRTVIVEPRALGGVSMPEVRNRPDVAVPSPSAIIVDGRHSTLGRSSLTGTASWFCGHGSPCTRGYDGGLYAAAGPALRVGSWRGRSVRVVAGSRSIRVTLIDTCACPNGRVLDLYSDAFSRLAPLSRGVVRVEVTW